MSRDVPFISVAQRDSRLYRNLCDKCAPDKKHKKMEKDEIKAFIVCVLTVSNEHGCHPYVLLASNHLLFLMLF